MSSVGSSSLLWGLVDLDVGNLQLRDIQTLGLSIGTNVGQQIQKGSGSLLWPSNLVTSSLIDLSLSMSTSSTIITSEWDGFFVFQDIFKIRLGSD